MPIPVVVHLSLLGSMVVLCTTAAIIARKRSGNWLPRHRLIAALGVCLGLAGVSVMVFEKIEHGYAHFASPHAIGGLLVGILLVVVPLLGFLGSRGVNKLRLPHRILARTLVVLAPVVAVAGVLRYLELSEPAPAPAAPAPSEPAAGS